MVTESCTHLSNYCCGWLALQIAADKMYIVSYNFYQGQNGNEIGIGST